MAIDVAVIPILLAVTALAPIQTDSGPSLVYISLGAVAGVIAG